MKATMEKWEITLDQEAIKAIRFVNGFTPDLRVKLTGVENTLWDYLNSNIINLFGYDTYYKMPKATDLDWGHYERMLHKAVRTIMDGR